MIHSVTKETLEPGYSCLSLFFFVSEARGGENEGASTEATEAATLGCDSTLVCEQF